VDPDENENKSNKPPVLNVSADTFEKTNDDI
jgi:hypothetical protein